MLKIIELEDKFYSSTESSIKVITPTEGFIKTAGVASEITDFLKIMRRNPGRTYLHINAVGAGEFWGSNRNGDYFPEQTLIDYHKVYEHTTKDVEGKYTGNVFKHHVNKNSYEAYGKVLFSYYNPRMHRVELIAEIIDNRAPDIIEEVAQGRLPKVSMGMSTTYDICSLCGNKARTLVEYCDHLTTMMNQVTDKGVKIYAINPQAKFFDISFVTKPAWEAGSVLQKVANVNDITSSAKLGDTILKTSEIKKSSDIVKAGPHKYTVEDRAVIDGLPDLSNETCHNLSKKELVDLVTTMRAKKSFVSPRSFQRIMLMKTAQYDLLDKYEKTGKIFNPFSIEASSVVIPEGQIDQDIEYILEQNHEKTALDKDLITNRLQRILEDYRISRGLSHDDFLDKNEGSSLAELYSAAWQHFKKPSFKIPMHNRNPVADPIIHTATGYTTYKYKNNLTTLLEKSPNDIIINATSYKAELSKTASSQNFEDTFYFLISLVYK